jgi:hypothetical protein
MSYFGIPLKESRAGIIHTHEKTEALNGRIHGDASLKRLRASDQSRRARILRRVPLPCRNGLVAARTERLP